MNVINTFSDYMYRTIQKHPERARSLLLKVFQGFGFYQKHFPDQKLPESRQYLATVCMQYMLNTFGQPEKSALTSIFMPCELLQAFGIPAMCAEMFSTYMNGAYSERAFVEAAENAGISETFCSYHKILIGGAETGVLPPVKAIVNSSLACDANNLTFRYLSHKTGAPQYYVDVPYERSEASVRYVIQELKELTAALEEMTGKQLDEEKLKQIVQRSAETTANLRATIPYRKERYLGGTLTSELYETLMVHNALGSEEVLEYSRRLLKDYQEAPACEGLRIVWMHSNPFWQKPVKNLFNENPEQRIVATELGYDNWSQYDPSDPYDYMARRLVYNPYNGKVEARIGETRKMAEKLDADGIICFCHWGCKETCGASVRIKKELEEAGYPALILNGDGVDRQNVSDGQTSTRVAAFVEMLKERRK
jgi:benzoyl-CoA reductase/2-hydroxyglutaryl-CoA dehydratase subunit BcrC/BadD/HgdB